MNAIKCTTNEQAVEMLQNAKEFFQSHVDMSNDPTVIAFHLSLIDAVQQFINNEPKHKAK